jgi:S1-C subfamily serine protease
MLCVCGCKSPSEQVDKFLAEDDYAGALLYLTEKGVAPSVSPQLDTKDEGVQKLLVARQIYQESVEKRYGAPAETAFEDGKSRQALRLVEDALKHCAWSARLQQLKRKAAERCVKLDQGIAEAATLSASDAPILWAYLKSYKDAAAFAVDDSRFRDALTGISRQIAKFEANGMSFELKKGDVAAVKQRVLRLKQLYVATGDVAKVEAFAQEALSTCVVPRVADQALVAGFVENRKRWSAGTSEALRDVVQALLDAADDWMARSLRLAVEQEQAEKGLVDAVEELFLARGSSDQALLSLAKLHKIRGARLAKEGANASAALFHFERAKELDSSMDLGQFIALARSTRGKLKAMNLSLSLSSGSEATPETVAPLYYITALNLIDQTRDGVRWSLAEPETSGADVTLFFQKTERHVPSISDLSVVSSKYFAHMQTVPNPQKAYLKGQLSAAEISYDFALSSYNSAVTSFNIYPSQYSLNSVNYAKNNLSSARNHYNSLVSLYNATPSTVQEPVYLPYSYFEGNMRCGYYASGKIFVQGMEAQFASDRVDSHYVRLNTKFTDVNASSRRDVHYPVENISEQLYANIYAVAADVSARVSSTRILPKDEFVGNLSDPELACVAYAMHPLLKPNAVGLGVPSWALKFTSTCRFEGAKVTPPALSVARCSLPTSDAYDDPVVINNMRGQVCRIDCKSPFGNSLGSGALVSQDGHILTAAHVIRGSDNKVVFNTGPNKGEYQTEIVFVDDRNDVALIRAKGLKATRWFNLRLAGFAPAGEPVMAIGYPSRPSSGDDTQDFVTKGIIAASNSTKGWLVADLTVASGNSGGPLISVKTGEVVGVVSQVISASIKKDFASSGYWCKAFPAARLTEALGVKVTP